jgi:hypothetical protein
MKLYAIFDPKGNLARPVNMWDGKVFLNKTATWFGYGWSDNASIQRAKRAGYTCEEVEIRKVQK